MHRTKFSSSALIMDARLETAIQGSEQFRLLVEAVQEYAIYMLDLSGHVLTWNLGVERIKGYSADEVVGKHFSIFYTETDRRACKPEAALAAAKANGSFVDEGWRVRKDGCEFWASVVISSIYDGVDLIGFAKVTRDLTSKKAAELAWLDSQRLLEQKVDARTRELNEAYRRILDSQTRYEAILTSISAVIWRWHPELNDFESVPSWSSYTGLAENDLVGWNWVNAVHPDEREVVVSNFRASLQREATFTLEFRLRHHDGSYRYISTHGVPIRGSNNEIVDWIGICIDITDRRNIEEQLRQSQKLEAVGQLAGGIAHDFNNLLTVILSYAELLEGNESLPQILRQMLTEIVDSGRRAAALTHQLLVFSRHSVVELKSVDVNEVVTDMDALLRRTIGEDIDFESILDSEIAPVRADRSQLGQVILNLAINARDAMPRGGRLTIQTRNVVLEEHYANTHVEVEPGRYVLLTVSDNGIGMSPEIRTRIFEPFYTTKQPGKGTGLGLSVVHGILTQFGARVGVYSESGIGTVFKIYLPIASGEMLRTVPVESAETCLRGSGTILIVDDDAAILRVAAFALETQGYLVLTASKGVDALEIAQRSAHLIDLLISDVVMPEMSGPQLVSTVRQLNPNIKVLYSSGYTDDAIVRHGLLSADVNFLPKPFTPRSLCQKVQEMLRVN